MAESNADVYASFGVNSAVMSGPTPEEHEANMLALDVDTRDGDDAIEVESEEAFDPYANTDKFADPDAPDDGRMQIRIGTEADAEGEPEVNADAQAEDAPEVEGDFEPLGDAPQDLTEVTKQITEHEQGFQEMIADAMTRGLTQESLDAIEAEYAEDGLSEESYAKLKEVGYSKTFIDSYLRGQEALVSQYVNQAKAYAGGPERFDALHAHLKSSNPEAAQSLETAFANRDLATVKAIVNLAGTSFTKKFGKPAERSLTARAVPAKPAPKAGAEGFATRDEMIKAMSDSRYRHDAAYRREVEQKTMNARF